MVTAVASVVVLALASAAAPASLTFVVVPVPVPVPVPVLELLDEPLQAKSPPPSATTPADKLNADTFRLKTNFMGHMCSSERKGVNDAWSAHTYRSSSKCRQPYRRVRPDEARPRPAPTRSPPPLNARFEGHLRPPKPTLSSEISNNIMFANEPDYSSMSRESGRHRLSRPSSSRRTTCPEATRRVSPRTSSWPRRGCRQNTASRPTRRTGTGPPSKATRRCRARWCRRCLGGRRRSGRTGSPHSAATAAASAHPLRRRA